MYPGAITEGVSNVSANTILLSFQGAAFGFNVIAAKAGEQLAPFLPQLLPRLYRYQFDPNLGIRQAMTSIWNALVTDKSMVSDQQSTARGLLPASSVSEILVGQVHFVKGGAVQKGVRYCPGKEVLESMDELEPVQRFCAVSHM